MNLRRVKALAKKEFIQIRRDPRSLVAALVLPLLMIFLFGYALSLDVDRIPTLVLDLDQTPASRDFIHKMSDSRYFDLIKFLDREAEIEAGLDRGQGLLAVVIPSGFAARTKKGFPAPIQAIIDGSDSNTASIAMGYLKAVAAGFDLELQKARIKKSGLKMADMPLEARVRVWFNPELRSRNFIVPGLTAVVMMAICSLMTSLSVSKERETGTLEQLISTPVNSGELLMGKLLPYLLIGLTDMAMVAALGVFVFGVPFRGSVVNLFLAATVSFIGTLSWGLFVSVVSRTQVQASQITLITVFLPSFLLSGFIYPIENMPVVLQVISYIVPARYFVEIMTGLFLEGVGLDHLWPQLLAMVIYSILVLNLARWKFSKRLL